MWLGLHKQRKQEFRNSAHLSRGTLHGSVAEPTILDLPLEDTSVKLAVSVDNA